MVVALALCVAQPASAQIGNLGSKLAKKAKEKVSQTVEKTIDNALNNTDNNAATSTNAPSNAESNAANANAASNTATSNANATENAATKVECTPEQPKAAESKPDTTNKAARPKKELTEAEYFEALKQATDKALGREPLPDVVDIWFSDANTVFWGTWNRKTNTYFRTNSDGSTRTYVLRDDNKIYNGSGKVVGTADNNTLTEVGNNMSLTYDMEKLWIYGNGKPIGVITSGEVNRKDGLQFHIYRMRCPLVFMGYYPHYLKEDLRLPLWVCFFGYSSERARNDALKKSYAFQEELENYKVPQSRKLKPWIEQQLIDFIKTKGHLKLNGKEGKILHIETFGNGWTMSYSPDVHKRLVNRATGAEVLFKFDDCYRKDIYYMDQDYVGGDAGDDSSYGPLYIRRGVLRSTVPIYR